MITSLTCPREREFASIRREDKFGVFEIKNISKNPLNISPEELTERFVRGDASRGSEEGNGLGLSIAESAAKEHGGSISVYSENGRNTFTVTLPK